MSILEDLGAPEFSIVNKRKLNTTPHYVYVAYGSHETVLYVGQTRNVPGRMAGHRKNSGWWGAARHIDFWRCESRRAALELEVEPIGELRPIWNATSGNYIALEASTSYGFEEVIEESVEPNAA